MRSLSNEKCLLSIIIWWSLAVSAVVAIIVTIVIKRQRCLLEKRQDERDGDIKECGC